MNQQYIKGYPETDEPINYSNHYGTLTLVPVTEYRHVNTWHSRDIPEELKYPIERVEQLVLISENRRLQTCFGWPLTPFGYVLHHSSPSRCALCRIESMTFGEGVNAREVLARPQLVMI